MFGSQCQKPLARLAFLEQLLPQTEAPTQNLQPVRAEKRLLPVGLSSRRFCGMGLVIGDSSECLSG